MVDRYVSEIGHSETVRPHIKISRLKRGMFPKTMEDFRLKYKNKIYVVKIDKSDRIWIGKMDLSLREGDKIVMTKESPGVYSLSKG